MLCLVLLILGPFTKSWAEVSKALCILVSVHVCMVYEVKSEDKEKQEHVVDTLG